MANANSNPHPRPAHPSTGPRTPEGKARSSMNAVTHGLTAKTALIPGEDPAEFREFAWEVVLDLSPQGPVQRELAAKAASLMWKRRRVDEAERQIIQEQAERYVKGGDEDEDDAEGPKEIPIDPSDPLRLVRFITANQFAGKREEELTRLARHEERIDRQIDSTLRLLLKLQNRRDWKDQQHKREQGQQRDAERTEGPGAGPT